MRASLQTCVMVLGSEIRFDESDNECFGCSQHHDRGLRLTFRHVGPSAVETRYTVPADLCGAPGVIHGGIQAVLLDEAIGFAVHVHDAPDDELTYLTRARVVTAEFDLRYRRPAPTDVELTVRGEVLRVVGRDYLCVAELLDDDGEVLTSSMARWRRLD